MTVNGERRDERYSAGWWMAMSEGWQNVACAAAFDNGRLQATIERLQEQAVATDAALLGDESQPLVAQEMARLRARVRELEGQVARSLIGNMARYSGFGAVNSSPPRQWFRLEVPEQQAADALRPVRDGTIRGELSPDNPLLTALHRGPEPR